MAIARGNSSWNDMPIDESAAWLASFDGLAARLGLCSAFWMAVHWLSSLVWPLEQLELSNKDRLIWHNSVTSLSHAGVATLAGGSFFLHRPEASELIHRNYGFSEFYDAFSTLGCGYMIYDCLYFGYSKYLFKRRDYAVLMHHILLIMGFVLGKRTPTALSIYLYHGFQLTEVSTIFLHLNWFLEKARARISVRKICGVLFVVTFGLRVSLSLALGTSAAMFMYARRGTILTLADTYDKATLVYFLVGSLALGLVNCFWFRKLWIRFRTEWKRAQKVE